jgi:hypothetical protein
MTNPTASQRLSLRGQDLAAALDDMLAKIAGESIAFVLVMSADNVAQYISNATRDDGRAIITSLLARWNAGRADIPAHYNPDLRPGVQPKPVTLAEAVVAYADALEDRARGTPSAASNDDLTARWMVMVETARAEIKAARA